MGPCCISTLKQEQHDRHFADDIIEGIFQEEKFLILILIPPLCSFKICSGDLYQYPLFQPTKTMSTDKYTHHEYTPRGVNQLGMHFAVCETN